MGWLDRGLDRELGPAPEQAQTRDSWVRDWPLLLGLVLSAALIAVSMTVRGSEAKPVEAPKSTALSTSDMSGQVVDVGEGDSTAPGASPADKPPTQRKKKTGERQKSTPSDPSSSPDAGASPAPAAETPSSSGSGSSGGGSSSSPGSGRSTTRRTPSAGSPSPSTDEGAALAKIVNVTGTSARFSNGPLSYTFKAPTHTPVVGKPWVLSVTGRKSGAPLRGTVRINIMHQGKVVAKAASGPLSGGRFAHRFDWPDKAVGHPIVVQTTIIGGGFQQSFLFAVKVRAAG